MHDAALGRPAGERAAAAELDVVGVGGDGERRRRGRESEPHGCSTGAVEVLGQVDVPPEAGVAHGPDRQAEPLGLGDVAGERARAVGEAEPDADGTHEHVRAVVAAVGHERAGVGDSR